MKREVKQKQEERIRRENKQKTWSAFIFYRPTRLVSSSYLPSQLYSKESFSLYHDDETKSKYNLFKQEIYLCFSL